IDLFQTSRIGLIGGVGLGYHTNKHWNFYISANLQEYDVSDGVITDLTNQFIRSDGFLLIDERNGMGTYSHYQVMVGAGRSWFFNNVELEPVLSFGITETEISAVYSWKTKQIGSNFQEVHEFSFDQQNSSFTARFHLATHIDVLVDKKAVWQLGIESGCSFQPMQASGNLIQKDILGRNSTLAFESNNYGLLFFLGIGGRVRF
ncbi:MAG: hypothetical protein ACPGED_08940, partial [Flavobacteriales bacterium]